MSPARESIPQPYRAVQIGLGSLGIHIAEALLKRKNIQLVGVVDSNPDLAGTPLRETLPAGAETTLTVQKDLTGALQKTMADVALVATSSSLRTVFPTIRECLEAGLDVVSICEELSFPYKKEPKIAEQLDTIAKERKKTVVGTGINPGYLMDLLPTVLTAPCQTVDTIRVTRHMNSSHRRFSFQKKIGTGMTIADFRENIDQGKITGHVGLVESIQMIDAALNLGLDKIQEIPPEAIIADREVSSPFTTIKKGNVLGLKSVGVGKRKDDTVVTLDFRAYAEASPEYDEVVIEGLPRIHERIEGGVQGDQATIGMILNLVPLVVDAEPGLKTMKDLPVPRNTERHWRKS
jgi:hypothetical protein